MALEAVFRLNSRSGSGYKAIEKYIGNVFESTNPRALQRALKASCTAGQFIKVRSSYKLSASQKKKLSANAQESTANRYIEDLDLMKLERRKKNH